MGASGRWAATLILIVVFAGTCGPGPARCTEQAFIPTSLPAEAIVELPLSAVLAPEKWSVLAPSFTPAGGAQLRVLRVLEEPLSIPLDRFLTHRSPSGEIVSHPFAGGIRDALEGKQAAALAVYVRVEAPAGTSAPDPLTSPLDARSDSLRPWTPLSPASGVGRRLAPDRIAQARLFCCGSGARRARGARGLATLPVSCRSFRSEKRGKQ